MIQLRNLSLSKKLVLIAILPIVLLGYISVDKISKEWKQKAAYEAYSNVLTELSYLENVIHEIQQERDLGALFLNDATTASQENLYHQWQETDSIVEVYFHYVEEEQLDTTLCGLFSEMQKDREKILSFKFESNELEFVYNLIVESVMGYINKPNIDSFSERSFTKYNSHISLLWTKEYLGRLRSNLNTLFTLGGFGDLNYGIFAVNKGGLESNMNNFLKSANLSVLNEYERSFMMNSGRFFSTIDYVFENPKLERYPFEKNSWWLTATTCINNLKEVSFYSISEMKSEVDELIKKSDKTVWSMLIYLSLAIIIVTLFCIYVINSLTLQVKEIQRASRKIITGDTEILVPVRTSDAIGSLAESFNSLVINSRKLASIADKIGKGDYKVDVPVRSGKDKLGRSLEEMRSNLHRTNTQLIIKAKELEETNQKIIKQNEELKEARSALHQTVVELQNANKYKSEFLANISHELRTPLNSILILTKILMQNKSNKMEEDELHSLKVIDKSSSDLLLLINDILDLSKIEAGKIDIELNEIRLIDSFNDIQDLFAPIANSKRIHFEIEYEMEEFQKVLLDRLRLEQILKNLLSNAFKFTPEDGKVILKAKQIGFEGFSIEVIDTGIGIPKEKLQSIFEAFKQVDGTTTRKYGGTGLGLTITKQLTELMNGKITVDSKEGVGTTFRIDFQNEVINTMETDMIEEEKEVKQVEVLPYLIHDIEDLSFNMQGVKILYFEEDITKVFELSAALNQFQIELIENDVWDEIDTVLKEDSIDCILINAKNVDLNDVKVIQDLENWGKAVIVISPNKLLLKDFKFKIFELGFPLKLSKLLEVLNDLNR